MMWNALGLTSSRGEEADLDSVRALPYFEEARLPLTAHKLQATPNMHLGQRLVLDARPASAKPL